MKVVFTKYFLTTKDFPIEFDCEEREGEMTPYVEEACLYKTEKDVDNELGNFDEPDKYQALPVKITYEF